MASTTAAASTGTGGSGQTPRSPGAPTRGAREAARAPRGPARPRCCTIDSMNGAVASPSYRGYEEVMARMFIEARAARAQRTTSSTMRSMRSRSSDPLLVLRRNELREQSERDELDARRRSRSTPRMSSGRVPMPCAPEPEHREVEQDDEADGAHEQADPAEEVERAVSVAPHERHAEQVEEAAQVALGAVPRPSVLARAVVHGDLGDAIPLIRGEHRDEAVELAVEAHALERPRPDTP